MKTQHSKKLYIVCFIIIWLAQMVTAFYFCTRKQGFHEDEYYTYYSTARTNGFYVEDEQWMSRETYRDEFVVLPGQQFRYGLVKQVQSWDVHPPVYYWVFHTVASLVPGVFSKWIGLSVNLFFHGINLILLAYLSYLISDRNKTLSLIVTLFYGLTPAAISGVVFIRMYEMLTMWVLLCSILHVRAVQGLNSDHIAMPNEHNSEGRRLPDCDGERVGAYIRRLPVRGFLIPIAVVTYLGFLTQYYYFIFLFFIGAAFCIRLLWHDRNFWNCLRYGLSQLIAFALAYLTYPSFPGQMFHGQRGAQATENFFDLSNTTERLRFFWNLLDEYVFGKTLVWLVLVLVLLGVTAYAINGRRKAAYPRQRKHGMEETQQKAGDIRLSQCEIQKQQGMKVDEAWCLLAFAVVGYFLAVSKTALLLGDTSNRYQLPIYGIIVLLLFDGIYRLGKMCVSAIVKETSGGFEKIIRYFSLVIVPVCLVVDLVGLIGNRVVFLYPEDEQQVEFARDRAAAGTPAIYLYQTGAEWCIWDVTNELLEYSEVYFASTDSVNAMNDEKIRQAESLVVYVADGADVDAQLGRILESNSGLTEYQELMFEEKYCDVYYLK